VPRRNSREERREGDVRLEASRGGILGRADSSFRGHAGPARADFNPKPSENEASETLGSEELGVPKPLIFGTLGSPPELPLGSSLEAGETRIDGCVGSPVDECCMYAVKNRKGQDERDAC